MKLYSVKRFAWNRLSRLWFSELSDSCIIWRRQCRNNKKENAEFHNLLSRYISQYFDREHDVPIGPQLIKTSTLQDFFPNHSSPFIVATCLYSNKIKSFTCCGTSVVATSLCNLRPSKFALKTSRQYNASRRGFSSDDESACATHRSRSSWEAVGCQVFESGISAPRDVTYSSRRFLTKHLTQALISS